MIERARLLSMTLALVLAVSGATAQWAQAGFQAGSYPAKVTGNQIGEMIFVSAAAELKCGTSRLSGQLSEASSSLTLNAQTEECFTGGGLVVMAVNMNGCTYRFTPGSELGADLFSTALAIQCPSGKEIVWENPSGTCVARTPAQEIPATMSFEDTTTAEPAKSVLLTTEATGIHYTLEKTFGCVNMPKAGAYTNGQYLGKANFTAVNAETSKPVDLTVK